MPELSVQIGADIQELLKKLNLSEKEFKKLALQAAKSGKTIEQVLKESGKGGKVLQKSLVDSSKGIDKFGKSTANAVPATQEFSRIIQDAPFGIQGVANNITQLTDQFGNLSRKTGGAGAALKAMLGTLSGPAGILLVVSAVTSLMVSYGDEIANVIKGNKGLAASQKAVNEALNEFYGDQATKINTYVSILEDANTSETQRKEITEELIKIVPTLTKADFKYGNNLDIVKAKIGNYVLAQASRIEADTLVQENSEKLATKARITQIQSIQDQEKRVEAFRKFLKGEGERIQKTSLTATYSAGGRVQDVDKNAAEITADFNKFADKLETELKPVQERINELYGTTFNGGLEDIADPKDDKSLSKRAKVSLAFDFELPQDTKERFNKFANGAIKELKSNFKVTGDLGVDLINVDGANAEIKRFTDAFQPFEDKLAKIPEGAKVFADATANAFSALGNQIATSLQTGSAVVDSFVGSIISSLSQMLAQMAATAITEKAIAGTKIATNQAVATSAAISAGAQSGAATGAAGFFTTPGFIAALVGIVGAAFAGIASFAKGGFSGDDNLAFLNKNELVLRPMEQAALYNAIRGGNLGSLSNNPTTSNLSDGIVGEVVLRGNNQVIQLRRSEKKMTRFYNS